MPCICMSARVRAVMPIRIGKYFALRCRAFWSAYGYFYGHEICCYFLCDFVMSFWKTISNDNNRNSTHHSVVVLKGSKQTIARERREREREKRHAQTQHSNQSNLFRFLYCFEWKPLGTVGFSLACSSAFCFSFFLLFSIVLIIYLWPQQLNFTTKIKR